MTVYIYSTNGYIMESKNGNAITKVYPIICDKLSITCDIPHLQQNMVFNNIKNHEGSHQNNIYHASTNIQKIKKIFPPYIKPIPDAMTSALLQCKPKDKSNKFLRLEFNPSKVDVNDLSVMLAQFIPDNIGYQYILENGIVTRIDFAVDVAREVVNDFLFLHPQIQNTETYHSKNKSGSTVYLGATTSERRFRIYDRVPSIRSENLKIKFSIKKEPIPKFDVMRIELILKPKTTLGNFFAEGKNPFEKLDVISPKGSGDDLWTLFLALARFEGAQAAMGRLSPKNKDRFKSFMDNRQVWWWKPEKMWAMQREALEKSIRGDDGLLQLTAKIIPP